MLWSYNLPFLDTLLTSAATVSVVADPVHRARRQEPALCLTIPVVYYGIMRASSCHHERPKEEPEKIMLKDKGMVASLKRG